jgi:hypothetical protein
MLQRTSLSRLLRTGRELRMKSKRGSDTSRSKLDMPGSTSQRLERPKLREHQTLSRLREKRGRRDLRELQGRSKSQSLKSCTDQSRNKFSQLSKAKMLNQRK